MLGENPAFNGLIKAELYESKYYLQIPSIMRGKLNDKNAGQKWPVFFISGEPNAGNASKGRIITTDLFHEFRDMKT
ncbi:MAG: hypothetical protein HYS21_13795 [Deltaproteobacteria bacterium]|nr:hypothetical protein [Deltaproteobacteria bacterium]